jgi:ribosomal protein S24E
MKVEILSEKHNPFLRRKEIGIAIEHESASTPSKTALQAFLSKEMKKSAEHIEIVNIFSRHGKSVSLSSVYIWDDKKAKDLSKKEEVVKKEEKAAENKEEPAKSEE